LYDAALEGFGSSASLKLERRQQIIGLGTGFWPAFSSAYLPGCLNSRVPLFTLRLDDKFLLEDAEPVKPMYFVFVYRKSRQFLLRTHKIRGTLLWCL
jgi:hypothetical protein